METDAKIFARIVHTKLSRAKLVFIICETKSDMRKISLLNVIFSFKLIVDQSSSLIQNIHIIFIINDLHSLIFYLYGI